MAQFLSLAEAIKANVRTGDTLALEGFTHLIPYAAGHEIIRQGITDLTVIRMTPDLIYDQMIGMGLVKKMIFSWTGNPGRRLAAPGPRRDREGPARGRSSSRSIRTRRWPTPTRRARPGCRARSSAATSASTCPR